VLKVTLNSNQSLSWLKQKSVDTVSFQFCFSFSCAYSLSSSNCRKSSDKSGHKRTNSDGTVKMSSSLHDLSSLGLATTFSTATTTADTTTSASSQAEMRRRSVIATMSSDGESIASSSNKPEVNARSLFCTPAISVGVALLQPKVPQTVQQQVSCDYI